jgi:hypothetical protein
MAITHCTTCGAELHGKSICQRCGTLVGIETRVRQIKHSVGTFIQEKTTAIPRRFQAHHFLWLCALFPLLLVPAAVSLVYAVRAMRAADRSERVKADFEWIAIVSAVNLIVSALLLYKFYFLVNELYLQGPQTLREALGAVIRSILRMFYAPLQPPAIKPTPV